MEMQPVEQDVDAATDQMLFRDNITWSKGRLRRAKVMSMFTGNRQPSRKKIFSEMRSSEDIQVWNIDVQGKSIRCAKIYNPAVLTKHGSHAWADLSGVQRLEIEDPEATQSSVPKQVVTELRHLESLSITWTKIKALPSALFQLPLNSLYLQRNQIKALNGIERASQLTILDISNNLLHCLPKTFGQLQSLVTLNLSGNWLVELPESIGSLSQMKTLDCSCNKLKLLPSSLGNLIELTSLDISTNQLTSLPESIGSLPKLEDLRLRSNHLASLPDSFGELNRLHSLLLRNNRFEEVPGQLHCLTNLQSLNMRENSIRHMDRSINPLKYLILDQNQLTQIDVGILQCPNLQHLSLKSNKLVEITGSITKLANIRSLNLSDNDIADIPVELGHLTHLRHLSLCSTKIRTVPLDVVSMPSLKTVELDECSELDRYLNIAYKTSGLPGVIEQLRKEETEKGESQNRKDVTSIVPDMPVIRNADGNKPQALRTVAGLSIVPGTSVAPPSSEAMLQVEVGSNSPPHLVHVARQSLCPPEKPSKPHKPAGLSFRSGTASSAAPSSPHQMDLLEESVTSADDSGVVATIPVATIPRFGDLTSTSNTETIRQPHGVKVAEVEQTKAQLDDNDEQMSALYATVTKKRGEQKPLVTGSSTSTPVSPPSVKPRPPTKKKPPKPDATS